MNRSDNNKEHDGIIAFMIRELPREGHKIVAVDHIPFPTTPAQRGDHIPDIVTDYQGKRIIMEVETCDSINDSHTEAQWIDFHKAPEEFWIIVPKAGMSAAKKRADELGIIAKILGV